MADRLQTSGGVTVRWVMDATTDLPTAIEVVNASTRQLVTLTVDGQAVSIQPAESRTTTIKAGDRRKWSWVDEAHYDNTLDMRRILVGPPWSLTRDG